MNLKIALFSATALGMLMATGVAYADNSKTVGSQTGQDNLATITQSGSNNNVAGAAATPLTQNGDDNTLHITQSNGAEAGLSLPSLPGIGALDFYTAAPGANAPYTAGINQSGYYNVINLNQSHGIVEQVKQTASNGNINATSNDLEVLQTGNFGPSSVVGDHVGSVVQTYTGTFGGGDSNLVSINQDDVTGAGGSQHPNEVSSVFQQGTSDAAHILQNGSQQVVASLVQEGGASNQATIGQHGMNNFINLALENGSSNQLIINQTGNDGNDANQVHEAKLVGVSNYLDIEQDGHGNQATVDIFGNSNGLSNFTSSAATAILSNANEGMVDQLGSDNTLNYSIQNADSTGFGFYQNGSNNSITGTTSAGSGNQVAVVQQGSNLSANFTQTGSGNVFTANQ